MDTNHRKRMDYYQYDKSPLRRSNLNKSKLEHSRSKSNPKDNIIRDTSPSFERKPSYNQLKNNRILDAKHYLDIKKASGGLFNQKMIKHSPINTGNSSKTNKSINSNLYSSKTKQNSYTNISHATENSFIINKNNSKSRNKYGNYSHISIIIYYMADIKINNKSQDKQITSKALSSSKSNLKSNHNRYTDNNTSKNIKTETSHNKNPSNNHTKTNSEVLKANIIPDRRQIVRHDSFYRNEINERLRISSKEKLNPMNNLKQERYNHQYLNTGLIDNNTNFTNSVYQENKHTFKPREDILSYDVISNESTYTNYDKLRKTKTRENEIRYNMSSNNFIKDKADLENPMKRYYLNNTRLNQSRNNENNVYLNETFGRISNKSLSNINELNRIPIGIHENTNNINPSKNKSGITGSFIDNKKLKENIQKYLKKNENNKILSKNSFGQENSFYASNQFLEYRNSNESRLNTDKSNKNRISTNYDKEIKISYDERAFSDHNKYPKQNQETGDSYKFKMTNTHSSGNASNPIDDYKNIKFENVEETHFINVYILQSSKNMLKIQEQIYDEKFLFKTVTQLEEEIDI